MAEGVGEEIIGFREIITYERLVMDTKQELDSIKREKEKIKTSMKQSQADYFMKGKLTYKKFMVIHEQNKKRLTEIELGERALNEKLREEIRARGYNIFLFISKIAEWLENKSKVFKWEKKAVDEEKISEKKEELNAVINRKETIKLREKWEKIKDRMPSTRNRVEVVTSKAELLFEEKIKPRLKKKLNIYNKEWVGITVPPGTAWQVKCERTNLMLPTKNVLNVVLNQDLSKIPKRLMEGAIPEDKKTRDKVKSLSEEELRKKFPMAFEEDKNFKKKEVDFSRLPKKVKWGGFE